MAILFLGGIIRNSAGKMCLDVCHTYGGWSEESKTCLKLINRFLFSKNMFTNRKKVSNIVKWNKQW